MTGAVSGVACADEGLCPSWPEGQFGLEDCALLARIIKAEVGAVWQAE